MFYDVRDPETNELLCRLDPDTGAVQLKRKKGHLILTPAQMKRLAQEQAEAKADAQVVQTKPT